MCNVYLKIPKRSTAKLIKKCVSANAVSPNKTKNKPFFQTKKVKQISFISNAVTCKKANFSDNADYRAFDFKITNIAVWVILNR